MVVSEAAERLELSNGARSRCSPARREDQGLLDRLSDPRRDCLLADRRCRRPRHRILAALRPAMATLPGARLIAIRAPTRGAALSGRPTADHGRPRASKLIWVAPSRTMNATIPAETVAAARRGSRARRCRVAGRIRTDLQRLFLARWSRRRWCPVVTSCRVWDVPVHWFRRSVRRLGGRMTQPWLTRG